MKPIDSSQGSNSDEDALEQEAADWLIRLERGLTPEENDLFQGRISEIPALLTIVDEIRGTWELLGTLSSHDVASLYPDQEIPAPFRPTRKSMAVFALFSLATLLLFGIFLGDLFRSDASSTATSYAEQNGFPTTRLLPDHSIARLNVGTEIELDFTEERRRVILKSGEAHFKVTEDVNRPFIVETNGIEFIAVGTSFNVKTEKDRVGLLVTEGLVQIMNPRSSQNRKGLEKTSSAEEGYPSQEVHFVASGQRAKVTIRETQNQVAYQMEIQGTAPREMEKLLAWRQPLLTLEGNSLGKIAENFKTKTGVELVIADPKLKSLKIGGRFSSEAPERFLEILRLNYGIPWYERQDGTLVVGQN